MPGPNWPNIALPGYPTPAEAEALTTKRGVHYPHHLGYGDHNMHKSLMKAAKKMTHASKRPHVAKMKRRKR